MNVGDKVKVTPHYLGDERSLVFQSTIERIIPDCEYCYVVRNPRTSMQVYCCREELEHMDPSKQVLENLE